MSKAYFVSGIDTDAGKSFCTGWLARQYMNDGKTVITQKFIQTGNKDFSEDIELHRQLMGIGMLPDDIDHTTAPVIFSYPASAQLAARIDNKPIDLNLIEASTKKLLSKYDIVLIEGAGGLMVPITDSYTTIDYVAEKHLPMIFVTNGRLGSINHTLLSLEAIKSRDIELDTLLYNKHFDTDPIIAADTRDFIQRYLTRHFPSSKIIDVPSI